MSWDTTAFGTCYPSESEWAWFGGVIDGEGHVSMVETTRKTLARRLAITNTNLPLLIKVAERFGGKIHAHRPPVGTNRQQFQWYTYGEHLRALLHGVLPYLIAKREEAEIYLAFDARHGRTATSRSHLLAWERQQRAALIERVQRIRKRGWLPTDVPEAFRPRKRDA